MGDDVIQEAGSDAGAGSNTDTESNTDATSEIGAGSYTGVTTVGTATTGSESFFSSVVVVPPGSCFGFFASGEGCCPVFGPEPGVLVTRRIFFR